MLGRRSHSQTERQLLAVDSWLGFFFFEKTRKTIVRIHKVVWLRKNCRAGDGLALCQKYVQRDEAYHLVRLLAVAIPIAIRYLAQILSLESAAATATAAEARNRMLLLTLHRARAAEGRKNFTFQSIPAVILWANRFVCVWKVGLPHT